MRRALLVAVAVLSVSLSATACLGESDPSGLTKAKRRQTSSTSTTVAPEIKVSAASVAVESMRVEAPGFPDAVRDAVVATLNAWVAAGVVGPLLSGQAPVGLDRVFTPVALGRLGAGSPDRAAMLEESGAGAVQPEKSSVALTGLAGPDGSIELVTAGVDVSMLFVSAGSQVRIARTGDVVLIPLPEGWRIDSYDVVTHRDTVPPPAATTTTGKKK
jgi:hypothetical protein